MEKLEYFEEYYVIRNALGVIHLQKNAGDPPASTSYDFDERDIYDRHKRDFKRNVSLASLEIQKIEDKNMRDRILKTMKSITKGKALKAVSLGKVSQEPIGIITKEQYVKLLKHSHV